MLLAYGGPSQDGSGMHEVAKTLQQQQTTLQSIVQMQVDLRDLIQKQQVELDHRLAVLAGHAYQSGIGSEVFFEERLLASEATEVSKEPHGPFVMTEEPRSSSHTHQSNTPLSHGHSFSVSRARTKKISNENAAGKQLPAAIPRRDFRCRLKTVLMSPIFDAAMGAVIFLNFAVIFAELEWKAQYWGDKLSLQAEDVSSFQDGLQIFHMLEKCFNGIYAFELGLHLFAFRCRCKHDSLQLLDMLAIFLSAADTFFLAPIVDREPNKALTLLRLAKVLRALRLLRFLRVLRFMGMVSALRVLVQTIRKSIGCLVWSMVVMSFIILSSAMFMAQLSQEILEDESLNLDLRRWIFGYYGGALRSSYTMFEATFSAKWATHFSDRLINEISPWFSVFWILYTVTVSFAVVRVISALFLKQTLDVAAIDAERVSAAKLKEQEKIAATLRSIFKMGDLLGDGMLHRSQLEALMQKDEVLEQFETLELDAPELYMLYNILAEDDGVADQEEFLQGAMKLKSQVKTVDIVHLLHEQLVIKRYMAMLAEGLQHLDKAVHPRNPWTPRNPLSGSSLSIQSNANQSPITSPVVQHHPRANSPPSSSKRHDSL